MSQLRLSNYDAVPASSFAKSSLDGTNNAISQLSPGLLTYLFGIIQDAQIATGAPSWGTWVFDSGIVGVAYQYEWDMPFSALTVVYSVLSGSLPTGLSLTSGPGNQGKISGTPSAAGTFSFTLRATNSVGIADQSFSITISAPSGGEVSHTFVC